jgi:pimeloyl-ACP methyl ester carboxylesterase
VTRAFACAVGIAAAFGCGSGGIDAIGDDAAIVNDARTIDARPPMPSGCVSDVSSGDHTYSCSGLTVDARIPAVCQAPGCGLILVLHGDTGTGLLMDGHVKLRELGAERGYIVLAPTGPDWPGSEPGSTWNDTNDATLVSIVELFTDVFHVDAKKVHVTGFSRGAFVTWRLLCDHADLFASAAPAGAGFGNNFGETTCFHNGRAPSRKLPIVFLMGRTDVAVTYSAMQAIRDAAIANYGATGPQMIAGDANYTHGRWTGTGGTIIETFDHGYETVNNGPFASAKGHCIPGSTSNPYAAQYAIPCELPNAFVWGQRVMSFFEAHPLP